MTRVSGFQAVAGQYVGGGLYIKFPLERYETVEDYMSCTYAKSWWRDQYGCLVLTDGRLILVTNRWPAFPFIDQQPMSIPYQEIAACELRRRRQGLRLMSFFAPTLAITTIDGREHLFWPHIQAVESLVARIELLKAGKLRASRGLIDAHP